MLIIPSDAPWPTLFGESTHTYDQSQAAELPSAPIADSLNVLRALNGTIDDVALLTLGSVHLGKKFLLNDNADRRKTY